MEFLNDLFREGIDPLSKTTRVILETGHFLQETKSIITFNKGNINAHSSKSLKSLKSAFFSQLFSVFLQNREIKYQRN